MVNLHHVRTETPTPHASWRQLTDTERLARVKAAAQTEGVTPVAAKDDGQVIVLLGPVPAGKRGTLLLDYETALKRAVDPALIVWLEPLGDRNSLRNLRGIEFKS